MSTVVTANTSVTLENQLNPLNVSVSGPDSDGNYELELFNPDTDTEVASLKMDTVTFRALFSAMGTVLHAPSVFTSEQVNVF